MFRLYKLLLLAAVAWSFLMMPDAIDTPDDATVLLGGLLVLVLAALVAAVRPALRSGVSGDWFVRRGHQAWAAAVVVVLLASILLYPLYQMSSTPGPYNNDGVRLLVHGTRLAVAAVIFFLVFVSVAHGSLFAWTRDTGDDAAPFLRHPPGVRRSVRATGLVLAGLGLFVALLGAVVTLVDPSASDYWAFGGVAVPTLALLGGGLWLLAGQGLEGAAVDEAA